MELIKTAIKKGFYHLDCSEMYGTEEEVGRAIQESGVPREKLFITNKVAQGIDDIHAAIQKSLEKLQSHYFDLSNSRDDPIAEELTSSQLSYSYMYSVLCQVGCRLPACMEVNGTSQRGWEIQIDRCRQLLTPSG